MPIYEYRCRKCGQITEVLQRINDRPLRKCRSCSGRMEKIVSRTAFVLKGGGWYAEGYNKSGKKSKASGDTSSATKKPDSAKKPDGAKNKAAAAAAGS